ncbi:MAG TPA: bifunctional diaminohydroxyphosphoribosylaminopyrimidine deaminase/5-amino-6-(5-phosphoribosylamino)uracil reductase RibD [Planctomycetaceae bacterium]|nr:bifunctional diaminohydroxyphosphoribosylaminopyrimidine deaminase/5-amino-6-(5-phosphoribosylamino)uracil reductase RibD [Planctomycetaceae bacterium]
MTSHLAPVALMQLALQHARRGEGFVESNPMVGAVVASPNGAIISVGWHERFGGPHAEINAIRAAGSATVGSDLYVTLEPCSHFGKTPPCADAVIAAGFRRVFVGCQDPASHVAGQGLKKLRDAGIEVTVGLCEADARRLIAPFEMWVCNHRPWVHAKWAMTLDGRIASRTGHSKWISSAESRTVVHQLRGRMDAIITGAGTVRSDDPLLTARPPGPRTPLRVVIDADGASLQSGTKLVSSLAEGPVIACVSEQIPSGECDRLQSLGVEVFPCPADRVGRIDIASVLNQLGRRGCTNVLTEAGPGILGSLFDSSLIDEVHVFIGARLVGGDRASTPIGGTGREFLSAMPNVTRIRHTSIGDDLLIEGDVLRD